MLHELKGRALLGLFRIDEGLKSLEKLENHERKDIVNKLIQEFREFEEKNECTLSNWYKGCMLANFESMHDRPYEYVFSSIDLRTKLLKYITDDYLFCMHNPQVNMNLLQDTIGDILKRFK